MSDQNVEEESVSYSAPVLNEQANGVITIVLTADNHLGYTAPGQGPRKREERKQRLRYAFQQATDFAVGQGVDLFIQAGDLFDVINPDEQDRSFVAARLAQLRQAGVRTFALGGVHDTPADLGRSAPPPQISYARLGALHYFPPQPMVSADDEVAAFKPAILDIRGTLVGIVGVGTLSGQEGDPLAHVRIESEVERAAIRIMVLHAPIEGLAASTSPLDTRTQVNQRSIEQLETFRTVLAGYHHAYRRLQIGQSEVVVAGATQHIDFHDSTDDPGFVFLGIASDGLRWCRHIGVDALQLHRLVIQTTELWSDRQTSEGTALTEMVLQRLRPLCATDALVHLRFEGELTRRQYHQLDLNQIRRFGEEHCFALFIDDSALSFVAEPQAISIETSERFSSREELVAVADEWIAVARDERERSALLITKEELLAALDGVRYPASGSGSLH